MKKIIRSNYRVVVDVPNPLCHRHRHDEKGHAYMMASGATIAEQVDRHCDGEGKARVEFDEEYICTYCGYEWEPDEHGMPLCCDEAQEEWLQGENENE